MEFRSRDIAPESVSPLALAYLGDAVYELFVRETLIQRGVIGVNNLHRKTVKLVKASAQAELLHKVEDQLTEEEMKIVKKGRNTKSSVPRNVDMADYRYSTGFEALVGYLYLKGDNERFQELFKAAIEETLEV
ncbi:MAG: mini-ribonuclease [Clostridia bacterium]|nr:ribonuclease [Clostridiales bacterium]MDK2985941.1 mini-ribonuclease [Clostridia bacterium]